jgi:hypothetical protein
MITDLDIPVAERVAKLIRLLSSDREGEVVAAAAAIKRVLKENDLDFHALADMVTGECDKGATKSKVMAVALPIAVTTPFPGAKWQSFAWRGPPDSRHTNAILSSRWSGGRRGARSPARSRRAGSTICTSACSTENANDRRRRD